MKNSNIDIISIGEIQPYIKGSMCANEIFSGEKISLSNSPVTRSPNIRNEISEHIFQDHSHTNDMSKHRMFDTIQAHNPFTNELDFLLKKAEYKWKRIEKKKITALKTDNNCCMYKNNKNKKCLSPIGDNTFSPEPYCGHLIHQKCRSFYSDLLWKSSARFEGYKPMYCPVCYTEGKINELLHNNRDYLRPPSVFYNKKVEQTPKRRSKR